MHAYFAASYVVCFYIRLTWSRKINTQASLRLLFKYLKPSEIT